MQEWKNKSIFLKNPSEKNNQFSKENLKLSRAWNDEFIQTILMYSKRKKIFDEIKVSNL